ncbi:MAG TPA: MarR family transcriptional regulator [Burkholderiaceae bacterium]|jgi:DNA-binding MarR family transcriptional regulator
MTSRLRNFGFLLKEVSRLHTLNFEQHAGDLNLSMTQSKVLCYLQRNEGISQVQLAQITDTDPMTLVRILDRMEADGLVERRPDPNDRRARCLYLLEAAGPVLKEIWRVSDKARAKSFTRMSAEDREHLVRLLEQMYANLGQPALAKLGKGAARRTPVARKPSAAVKNKTVKE